MRAQLDEYRSMREGQRHLRELSIQRQALDYQDRRSRTPTGKDFLFFHKEFNGNLMVRI